ncbi:snRNA-activating protein complex subunit 5 [Cyanistes caeruleus]|uniref:snRNA-activating protein complex subunit 5 n=1 Tax=Cyanistes caeruleus TaxID=156563 RepID=UPI000CDA2C8D|nr:snRNA-activating protein complex subunit 5 [Cyanistes caeruleus]
MEWEDKVEWIHTDRNRIAEDIRKLFQECQVNPPKVVNGNVKRCERGRADDAGSAQCSSLQVEELALQSLIRAREENVPVPLPALAEDTQQMMDSEAAINQTELHLSVQDDKEEEEEEEEEESDS